MSLAKKRPNVEVRTWKFEGQALENQVVGATGAITIFEFPAKTVIHSVKAYVKSAVTGATSEIVGDLVDDNGYLVDGFAAATGFFPKTYAAASAGTEFFGALASTGDAIESIYYATANKVVLTLAGTATAGEIDFYIEHTVLE